jgi:hypothetical protein
MIFEDATTGYILNSYGIYPETVDLTVNGFKWEGITPPIFPSGVNKNFTPGTPSYL